MTDIERLFAEVDAEWPGELPVMNGAQNAYAIRAVEKALAITAMTRPITSDADAAVTAILRAYENDEMDAAGTIGDLVALLDTAVTASPITSDGDALRAIVSLADECAVFDQDNLDALKAANPYGDKPIWTAAAYWGDRCQLTAAFARRAHEIADATLTAQPDAELVGDAHKAIIASNEYIERLQAYVIATEQFLLTQDGEVCGLSGGSDDPGRGAKKAWQRFVNAREVVALLLERGEPK